MANDVSAAIRYFRDSVKTALVGRTFRLSLQLSTLQKTLSSLNDTLGGVGSRFAGAIEGFLARMQDNFLLESCLKYAEFEKRLPEPNEVSPFATQIPLYDDAAAFFCKIISIDAKLGHRFLSSMSIMNGNADPSKTDDELIEDILQTRNVRVFQEIAALTEASSKFFLLQDLELCIDECSLVNETPTHLKDEKVDSLVNYLSLIYPGAEGRSFQESLCTELEQKRGIFTTAEYNAMVGLPAPATVSVVNESPKNTGIVESSAQQAVEEPESKSVTIPSSYRVGRPPRFVGDAGERAFRCLYDKMNDTYFKCPSPENFTGLFSCPSTDERSFFTKIDWTYKFGRELQYFLEALYRTSKDKPAMYIPEDELSHIFLFKGETIVISSNSLYCWGKNKSIDESNYQEKRIRAYYAIIEKAEKASN